MKCINEISITLKEVKFSSFFINKIKILFLFERYGIRDLTFTLFVRLSVRLFVRLFPFILRSYRPIFKIIFLFERYNIRDFSFILSVRPFIRLSVRTPFQFRSYRPIFQILFFCLKGMTSET